MSGLKGTHLDRWGCSREPRRHWPPGPCAPHRPKLPSEDGLSVKTRGVCPDGGLLGGSVQRALADAKGLGAGKGCRGGHYALASRPGFMLREGSRLGVVPTPAVVGVPTTKGLPAGCLISQVLLYPEPMPISLGLFCFIFKKDKQERAKGRPMRSQDLSLA